MTCNRILYGGYYDGWVELQIDSRVHGRQTVPVSVEDLVRVQMYRWHVSRNRTRAKGRQLHVMAKEVSAGERRTVYLHRWLVDAPVGMEVDHIDGDPLNNRRCNLRIVSASANQHNQIGARGYRLHRSTGKYEARIRTERGQVSLGYFKSEAAARTAYLSAKLELHRDVPGHFRRELAALKEDGHGE